MQNKKDNTNNISYSSNSLEATPLFSTAFSEKHPNGVKRSITYLEKSLEDLKLRCRLLLFELEVGYSLGGAKHIIFSCDNIKELVDQFEMFESGVFNSVYYQLLDVYTMKYYEFLGDGKFSKEDLISWARSITID